MYFTSASGEETKGRLERLTAASADVKVSGATVHILERDVVKIDVPEPLWQGIVIGGASGAALGGLAQQAGEALGCLLSSPGECDRKSPALGLLAGAGLGAAIGAGLDALVWKRIRVFAAPPGRDARRLLVSPLIQHRRVAIRVTASF